MAELHVEIDFREVELGAQQEIMKACVLNDSVTYEVVADDEDYDGSGLEVGDLIINGTLCIERKAPGDFVSSMTSGHLEDQLDRMYEQYDQVYVLVSGSYENLKYMRHGPEWKAIRAFIASMSVRWQTVPLFCDSEEELAKTVIDLGRKAMEPMERQPGRPSVEVSDDLGPVGKAAMLTDGIGEKTAERIQRSQQFNKVGDLCEASVDELIEIEGIGPSTAMSINSTLS